MTERDRQITTVLIGLAEALGCELTETRIRAYLSIFDGLSVENVQRAATHLAKTHVYPHYPQPASFLEALEPDHAALAHKINCAVSKFGYTDGQGAKEYLGADAWAAVRNMGGWATVCRKNGVWANDIKTARQDHIKLIE